MAAFQVLFAFVVIPLLIAGTVIVIGTTLNFFLSRYIARSLSKQYPKYSRAIFWAVFVMASLAIHLHLRIPGMIDDAYHALSASYKVYQPVEVYIGSPVSIEINQDAISFKKRYLESPWLGDYGRSLSNPRITTDYFVEKLASKGLQLQRGTNTETSLRITGTIDKSDYHQTIKLDVIQNGNKVAEYNRRFRTSFAGEQSSIALIKLELAVLQSTPTRLLFPDFWDWSESQEYPISDFLTEAIHVSPRPVSLPAVSLKVSAFNTQIGEHLIPDDKLNLKEEICQWEQVKVRIFRRYVHQQESPQGKQAGYWLEIRSGDRPPILKYLQAPQGSIYQLARIHQTVCTVDQIDVLASFAGVGKTDAEWRASLERYSGPKIGRTPDEQKLMGEELKRVNAINERRIQNDFRKAWILSYSYDGELKEAASFTLPEDFPQHVDMLKEQQPGTWQFTGFDSERRVVSGHYMTFRTKDYEVLLEKEE